MSANEAEHDSSALWYHDGEHCHIMVGLRQKKSTTITIMVVFSGVDILFYSRKEDCDVILLIRWCYISPNSEQLPDFMSYIRPRMMHQ